MELKSYSPRHDIFTLYNSESTAFYAILSVRDSCALLRQVWPSQTIMCKTQQARRCGAINVDFEGFTKGILTKKWLTQVAMTTDGHQNTPTRPPRGLWSVVGGAGGMRVDSVV